MNIRPLIRNIFSSWAGYAVTLLVGFFLSPIVVGHLGAAGYGVWTLVVSLTGFCGLLDLGLRSSVVRFMVRDIAIGDFDQANRTLSSAVALLGAAGVLAFVATIIIHFSFGMFVIDDKFLPAARTAILFTGLNVSLILPLSAFAAVLPSLERYDVMNAITISGAIARGTLVVIVLKLGGGIVSLSIVSFVASTCEYSAMAVAARTLCPSLSLRWRLVDRPTAKALFTFGLFRFVWIVANQVIFYTDSLVIGAFVNAAAITAYAIAGSLVNYGRNIVSLATDTLFPAANRMDTRGDVQGLQQIHILGTRLGLVIGFSICLGFWFFGRMFIQLWMGEKYASSAVILRVLTIAQIISMSQYISSMILLGIGRHKLLAAVAVGEAAVNLTLSIVLVRSLGVIGVAWGTVVPHLIVTALIIPFFTLRELKLTVRRYLAHAWVGPTLCAIPSAVLSYLLSQAAGSVSWARLAASLLAQSLLFVGLAYLICLNESQRTAVRDAARALLHRRSPIAVVPIAAPGDAQGTR